MCPEPDPADRYVPFCARRAGPQRLGLWAPRTVGSVSVLGCCVVEVLADLLLEVRQVVFHGVPQHVEIDLGVPVDRPVAHAHDGASGVDLATARRTSWLGPSSIDLAARSSKFAAADSVAGYDATVRLRLML